jgi:hypothetical protein
VITDRLANASTAPGDDSRPDDLDVRGLRTGVAEEGGSAASFLVEVAHGRTMSGHEAFMFLVSERDPITGEWRP